MTTIAPLKYLTFEERDQVRDIFIPLKESAGGKGFQVNDDLFGESYAYTGHSKARGLFDGKDKQLQNWLIDLYVKSEAALQKRDDFRLEHDVDQEHAAFFRAKRLRTTEGWQLALRRIPNEVPELSMLRLPFGWHPLLLDGDMLDGGLVLTTATNGQGKTTTISAVVRSRLQKFGGHANCVEDPPEHRLGGNWFGDGVCNQIPVDSAEGYVTALRDALRFFPSMEGGGTVLMVGEVRDNEVAEQLLLSAANGHYVIATFHGGSITKGLERLVQMAGARMGIENARTQLASVLRLCLHQRLYRRPKEDNVPETAAMWDHWDVRGDVLYLPKKEGLAHREIAAGEWSKLSSRVANQTRQLKELASKGSAADKVLRNELEKALNAETP